LYKKREGVKERKEKERIEDKIEKKHVYVIVYVQIQ